MKLLCTAIIPNDSQWIINLSLEGLTVSLKLDTGSDGNILSISYYKKLKRKPEIKPTKIRYTGDIIPITEKIYITIQRKGMLHKLCFIITPRKFPFIIGKDACEKLNIIKRINFIKNLDKNNVLSAYKELFTGISCSPGRVSIKLKHETVPGKEACRKITFAMLNDVKAALDRMEEAGMIKRITQPTKWGSAMHIAYKLDRKLRICLDPRNLIKAILRKHFKLPTHEEVMARMAGAKIFSKLDCSKRFWQL